MPVVLKHKGSICQIVDRWQKSNKNADWLNKNCLCLVIVIDWWCLDLWCFEIASQNYENERVWRQPRRGVNMDTQNEWPQQQNIPFREAINYTWIDKNTFLTEKLLCLIFYRNYFSYFFSYAQFHFTGVGNGPKNGRQTAHKSVRITRYIGRFFISRIFLPTFSSADSKTCSH
jgi:hypothetical protein